MYLNGIENKWPAARVACDGINAMGPVKLTHANENTSFGVFSSPRNTSKKARIDCAFFFPLFQKDSENLYLGSGIEILILMME